MTPEKRLEKAYEAAGEGRHEEALREYVWFHDHALEIDPALSGVRLSYALDFWVQLAKVFPAARTALEEIRDRKVRALLAGEGNRALFHDIASINEYLGGERLTADAFAQLDRDQPPLANQCRDIALPSLVASSMFELARRYLKQPFDLMEQACERLNEDVDDLANEPPSEAPTLEAFVWIYASRIKLLTAVLRGLGEVKEAYALESAAVAGVKSPSVRDSVRASLATT